MKNVLAEKLEEDSTNMTNVEFDDTFIINFGFGTKDEKKQFLRENTGKKILMDLTCFDPTEFFKDFPQLVGVFSALFCDEEKRIEVHLRSDEEVFLSKLKDLGFNPVQTSILTHGFIFPRTIAQIINEAHFALAENVASREDIDRAMRFGVNYTKGPFQWAQGKERIVRVLLEELHASTNDPRYIPSPLLK
jgi:hypothetical protein